MKKKISLLIVAIMAVLPIAAQGIEAGVYKHTQVVQVPDVSAADLYVRSLEALSDWVGSRQKSKGNIDMQDKEQATVVYKGQLYLGYGKQNFMYGWETFADFTLKIRCKDGRAQITVQVPSLSYYWTADATHTTAPIDELLPEYTHHSKFLIKKASQALAPTVPDVVAEAIACIANGLAKPAEDDF